MDHRTLALKSVSEALHLDSSGFQQAAFAKYLQSLQTLSVYLNDMLLSLGFQNMLQKNREIHQVLCMVHECSDRVAVIVDSDPQKTFSDTKQVMNIAASFSEADFVKSRSDVSPYMKKLKNDNSLLLKRFKLRFERAKDEVTKSNLKLELQRQLVENDILMKKEYETTVQRMQKERVQNMENEMKLLFENQQILSEREREKRELYSSVLQYTKNETWPLTWQFNYFEMSTMEAASIIFEKTIRCREHPLAQWLLLMHTNIKREVDALLKKYSNYQPLLRYIDKEGTFYQYEELADEFILTIPTTGEVKIPLERLESLHKSLESISSEIFHAIGNTLEIFYLVYKSLLPENSEEECHQLIEMYFLDPIWPNLFTAFRISNIASEFKISDIIYLYQDCDPTKFGLSSANLFDEQICNECVSHLKQLSESRDLTGKLKTLILISQKICGNHPNLRSSNIRLGADELIPILCFSIVKSKLPQLSSECYAIEQLFDMKFMFGEEGYALSSFMTALKYLEMKKLIDGENVDENSS